MNAPTVSVVIPTCHRPRLVTRAIHSVLNQTLSDIEAIVVVDGRDDETVRHVMAISDERCRLIVNQDRLGGSEARNVGVHAARGQYIAFLDDDDEFLPAKLELQLRAVRGSSYRLPIGYCQINFRTPAGEELRPRRPKRPDEDVSEYIFCRTLLLSLNGMIQTDMLFVPRELMLEIPFSKGLRMHQDYDWLLRAAKWPETGFEFCQQPLAVVYAEESRQSVTNSPDWRYSLDWIQAQRKHGLVTRRAYAAFVLSLISRSASKSKDWKVFRALLSDALSNGCVPLRMLALHFGIWLAPSFPSHRWRSNIEQKLHSAVAALRVSLPVIPSTRGKNR